MKTAEALLSVTFNTSLKLEELNEHCQADLDYFRTVRGLIQKYYIVDPSTKTVNGIYLFETKTARAFYWDFQTGQEHTQEIRPEGMIFTTIYFFPS
jgi:hypothetical protein